MDDYTTNVHDRIRMHSTSLPQLWADHSTHSTTQVFKTDTISPAISIEDHLTTTYFKRGIGGQLFFFIFAHPYTANRIITNRP